MSERWRDPSIRWRGGNVAIPNHTREALVRYIDKGEDPYDEFVDALLEDRLRAAVRAADETNLLMLPHIVAWLYNYAPAACQGSPEKVQSWKRQGGYSGIFKEKAS